MTTQLQQELAGRQFFILGDTSYGRSVGINYSRQIRMFHEVWPYSQTLEYSSMWIFVVHLLYFCTHDVNAVAVWMRWRLSMWWQIVSFTLDRRALLSKTMSSLIPYSMIPHPPPPLFPGLNVFQSSMYLVLRTLTQDIVWRHLDFSSLWERSVSLFFTTPCTPIA